MMDDKELCRIVNSMEINSIGRDDTFASENQKAFQYFMGEPFGDEEDNRSQVISTDVADVVEADMTSLARVFLGSNEVVEFTPTSERPEDIQEAQEKNTYIPFVLRNCKHSFKKQHDWLKAIEIYKAGVLEYGIRTTKKVEKKGWKGLDALEMTAYLDEFRSDTDIKEVKVTSQERFRENGEDRFNIEVSLITEKQNFFIENIPIEDLILSKNCQTKDDADIVGKRWTKTRAELIEEGFDKEQVKRLTLSKHTENSQIKEDRFRSQGGDDDTSGQLLTSNQAETHWTMELVSGIDVYAKVDFDEDGVRERRHIIKSGNEVLLNDDFEHVPFAIASAILMPHNIIGRSRAEVAMPTQRVQSVLSRAVCDNIYLVNAGRNVISSKVNPDDMLAVRQAGIVRYRGEDPISNHVMQLVTPYVGDKTLQVIQYFDSKRAQTTGSLMANQGLQADDLHKETATRFEGVENASKAKVELLARVIAEVGYIDLYQGLAWFANHFQDDDQEFYVLGQTLTTNPSKWQFEHYVEASVGTGAGDDEQALQNYSALLAILEQLKARGSLLSDEKKIYNTIKRITKTIGIKDVSTVINDPERPDELLMAQNEQLQLMVIQLQQMLEMSSNPLAEAENIKAMKEIALKQQDMMNQNRQFAAELAEKRRQFDIKTQLEAAKNADRTAVDLTKMEIDSGRNVPGAIV